MVNKFLYARLDYYVIGYGGRRAGRCPHRFPHNNFSSVNRIITKLSHTIPLWKLSSVYWIFTKHGHMIPLWKGKNPIYFGVIRSKVKVTITINIIFDNRIVCTRQLVLYTGSLPNLAT